MEDSFESYPELDGNRMRFKATFKTPDVLDYALEYFEGEDRETAKELAEKYIEYGEYITIVFDTETQTATVLPIR